MDELKVNTVKFLTVFKLGSYYILLILDGRFQGKYLIRSQYMDTLLDVKDNLRDAVYYIENLVRDKL